MPGTYHAKSFDANPGTIVHNNDVDMTDDLDKPYVFRNSTSARMPWATRCQSSVKLQRVCRFRMEGGLRSALTATDD